MIKIQKQETFSGLIKCGLCEGNFKTKLERKIRKYVCSRYDNSRTCKRIIIKHDDLISHIREHYKFGGVSEEEFISRVERIIVTDTRLTIHYSDGTNSTIIEDAYLQY